MILYSMMDQNGKVKKFRRHIQLRVLRITNLVLLMSPRPKKISSDIYFNNDAVTPATKKILRKLQIKLFHG